MTVINSKSKPRIEQSLGAERVQDANCSLKAETWQLNQGECQEFL
eukprot:CAMPEP_0180530082 /NCGR_PEP_ID=MMETSP1036_2-20121128/61726_1 /TAXON_ID=632150 /ORGANISM="Azadinium spinosum, Strain 3D9" /LENGTH=44 /DNA_ID= /DNA_START= /DNA_END= /DNA_ORIENTATION=